MTTEKVMWTLPGNAAQALATRLTVIARDLPEAGTPVIALAQKVSELRQLAHMLLNEADVLYAVLRATVEEQWTWEDVRKADRRAYEAGSGEVVVNGRVTERHDRAINLLAAVTQRACRPDRTRPPLPEVDLAKLNDLMDEHALWNCYPLPRSIAGPTDRAEALGVDPALVDGPENPSASPERIDVADYATYEAALAGVEQAVAEGWKAVGIHVPTEPGGTFVVSAAAR